MDQRQFDNRFSAVTIALMVIVTGMLMFGACSCTTIHRTQTQTHTQVDSVHSSTLDTTATHEQVDSSDTHEIDNVSVTIEYDSAETKDTLKGDTATTAIGKIVKEIVKGAKQSKQKIKDITIYIGKSKDSTGVTKIKDSIGKKTKDTTALKKQVDTKQKTVDKKRSHAWIWIGLGIFIIVGALYAYVKFHINSLKKII